MATLKVTKKTKHLSTSDFFELWTKMLKDSIKGRRLHSNGRKLRSSTLKNYQYVHKQLEEFAQNTGFEIRIYLNDHLSTREKEQAKKYYKKFYTELTTYLYNEKGFYDNYVTLIIKILKAFFNYLNKEYNLSVGEYHKQFYTFTEAIDIIVLSPEQLHYLIHNQELNKILPEHLIKTKDIFVFGCTVALRFSDLMKLKQENLHFYNNAYYLKVTSLKTNTNTTIKLPDYAVDILKKYHKKEKTLLPQYSNGRLNICLKEMAKYLEFNEPMPKYRTKRGVKELVYKNKVKKVHYTMKDHMTTHTMRRTAITNMLRLGMPDQVVRKISGHAANSKEFYRYVEFAQSYIDEHTDKVFEKINNLKTEKSVFS